MLPQLPPVIAPLTPAAAPALTIPLDSAESEEEANQAQKEQKKKKKLVRDSQTRREMLLKGKEGSRRRQRWENDRFLHNPAFVPPSADDFAPQPLYQKRTVPYQYASLWEHPKFPHRPAPQHTLTDEDRIPRELRVRLKKARGALGLLERLEREVREFLLGGREEDEEEDDCEDSVHADEDSEEEEIVFVSKRARMREKVLFQGVEGDKSASFGRWLVHSIAAYYGLQSYSVTEGKNPAVRYAYVAKTSPAAEQQVKVPRPLYLML